MDFDNPLALDEAVVASMRKHAVEEWPKESCGLVVDGQFLARKNISPEPEDSFAIDPGNWVRYDQGIQGVVHSHCLPKHSWEPSRLDMELQIPTDVPWGVLLAKEDFSTRPIWWGDFRLDQPLLGRPFIHGVLDCYSLIRSYYWQTHHVKLVDVPRDNFWWMKEGEDLYRKNFARVGGFLSDRDDLQVGDVIVFRMRGGTPHHAGVYIGNNLMFHHLQGKKSSKEIYGRWEQFATHFLRWKESCYA